jgi:hypothetical protein
MKMMRTHWSADFPIGALRKQRGGFGPIRKPALRLALALLLAGGFSAAAQSNSNRVPGPTDYARFSQFITERNIFNPNRYAIYSPTSGPVRPRPVPRNTPTFTLVGTMNYEKGMFAFFDGNQSNLRKVLYQSDSNSIAGFTLAEITPAGVKLQAADKKQIVELNIGQGMQLIGNSWQKPIQGGFSSGGGNSGFGGFAGQNRGFDSGSSGESAAPAADSSSPDASAAPSPALEGNDVLKKLMQQRQQELK